MGGVMSLRREDWKGCMCRCVAKLKDCNCGWLGRILLWLVWKVDLVDFGRIGLDVFFFFISFDIKMGLVSFGDLDN